jgi:serine/threonine-protein kinase
MNLKEPFRPSYRGVAPGTRLNGIYEVDQMIGAGGMGEVYRCHEIQTGAVVAIKMLLPEMAENDAALALFRREAAALHHLLHDAIVRYFVFSVEPALQRPYLAMEFVDGRSLSDVLANGPLSFEALVKLMRRIASGLQAAHERGVIHRDVSPDNIIVPLANVTRAKIIDFGIARSTEVGDKTIIGSGFAGKDNYVSPEQVGLYGHEVTAKSDIYSLGLVLFHALTGQKLDMGGSQFQLVAKRQRVPDLGGVDLRIRPLLEQMLQPDPAKRPATMADIADWRFASPSPQRSGRRDELADTDWGAQRRPAAQPASKRKVFWRTLAAAGLIAVVAVGSYAFYALVWSGPDVVNVPPPPQLNATPQASAPAPKPSPAVLAPPPVAPASSPSDAAVRTDRVRRYIEQFDGGDCFFIMPVAISSSAAVIEGFGASTAPFDALDKAFKRDLGFEASIGVRQVTQAQCPAIKFLAALNGNRARAPRINLNATEVRSGEALSGTIENFANRVPELLLVSDSGEVQNLSYLLKPGTDAVLFAIPIQRGGEGPQLVMAVTTPQVIDALRQPKPVAADTFFLQALSETQRRNLAIAAAARYVRLKN